MTDWLGFRAAVLAAVSAALPASVLGYTAVNWADGSRELASHRVLLSVVSAVFDDRDSALSQGGVQSLESMAVIVVQITAESGYDTGDQDGLWLIEQLRLGLRKVSVQQALSAAGIVVQAYPRTTRNVGGVADDRALSVHMIEVTFCATFALVPDPAEDAGLIEHIEVAATLDDHGADVELELAVDDPAPEP